MATLTDTPPRPGVHFTLEDEDRRWVAACRRHREALQAGTIEPGRPGPRREEFLSDLQREAA